MLQLNPTTAQLEAILTVDFSFVYVWLIWASVFLLPCTAFFVERPTLRWHIRWASALTASFGLTELLFVPTHWNPPRVAWSCLHIMPYPRGR